MSSNSSDDKPDGRHHTTHSSNESDGSEHEEDMEYEIHNRLEQFYDNNYFKYEVTKIEDYVHSQIWNVHIDEIKDLVYLVQAEYEITNEG